MTTSTSKPGWLLCVGGAIDALERLQADLDLGSAGNDANALRAACEAIWWTAAADEMLMEAHSTYKNVRTHEGWDDVMSGLRWARNRITHQESHWKIVQSPFVWGDQTPITCLPNHDKGRSEYITKLQGKPVKETIEFIFNKIQDYAVKFPW